MYSLYDFEIVVPDYPHAYEPDGKESVGNGFICNTPGIGQGEEKLRYPECHVDVEQYVPDTFLVAYMQM